MTVYTIVWMTCNNLVHMWQPIIYTWMTYNDLVIVILVINLDCHMYIITCHICIGMTLVIQGCTINYHVWRIDTRVNFNESLLIKLK